MSIQNAHTKIVIIFLAASFLVGCGRDPQRAKAKYLASGQNFLNQKKYGDATVEFRNAIRMDPRSAEAYYQLAQAEIGQQNWKAGFADLEKAIELDPARLDARLERARLYVAAREFLQVEQEANEILQRDPKNADAYELIGGARVGEGKPEEALQAFSKVAELRPNDANCFRNLAMVEVKLRRFPDAEEHLKRASAIDPKSAQVTIDLATFYRQQGRFDESEKTLEAGVQRNPDALDIYLAWANFLSERGKTTEMEGVLDNLRNRVKSPDAAIAIGDFYLRKDALDKALAEYIRGLSVSAKNLDLEKRILGVYLTSNQIEKAAELDGKIMKQVPSDTFAEVLHGRVLLAQGKKQEAIIALQGTVKNAPNSADAHYYLGLAYWQNGNLGQADGELKEALKVAPGMPPVLRSLVELSVAQNRPSEAQSYAQELVEKNPTDVNARLLLGSAFLRQAQNRKAEEQFAAAERLAPNQASVHLSLGQLHLANKNWAQAEKEFEAATQLAPADTTMLAAYTSFLASRQQLAKAEDAAQQFVNANPNVAQGHVVLGGLKYSTKDSEAARLEFEKAIQLDPQNILGYVQLAVLYRREGQMDAAIGQYQKALGLQPRSALLLTLLGNMYLEKDELDEAGKYFAKALEADANYAPANANLAWVHAQQGKDLDVALGLAQKAKSLNPDDSAISDVGWVMYKKGNYSGAIPLHRDCVKKTPDSAQYHYHLGLDLIAAGQKEPGSEQLQAALKMNKLRAADQEQAKHALAQEN